MRRYGRIKRDDDYGEIGEEEQNDNKNVKEKEEGGERII